MVKNSQNRDRIPKDLMHSICIPKELARAVSFHIHKIEIGKNLHTRRFRTSDLKIELFRALCGIGKLLRSHCLIYCCRVSKGTIWVKILHFRKLEFTVMINFKMM